MVDNLPTAPLPAGEWCTVGTFVVTGITDTQTYTGKYARYFDSRLEQLKTACQKLGGVLQAPMAGADLTCRFQVTPFFPVLLQFWAGDEEFQPRLLLLWDRHTDRFMHFETTFYLQGDLLARLKTHMDSIAPVLYKNAPNRRKIQKLYFTAFPKYEQMPWWLLRLLTVQPGVALTGYYDKDTFCGFTYTVTAENMLFVMFFAVNEALRGKGYGSAILKLLKENNPGKTILLNVELLDQQAPNYEERVRRFKFYEKNGFYDTGFEIDEVGGTFRVLASQQQIDAKAYQRVFQKLSWGLWKPKITYIGKNYKPAEEMP